MEHAMPKPKIMSHLSEPSEKLDSHGSSQLSADEVKTISADTPKPEITRENLSALTQVFPQFTKIATKAFGVLGKSVESAKEVGKSAVDGLNGNFGKIIDKYEILINSAKTDEERKRYAEHLMELGESLRLTTTEVSVQSIKLIEKVINRIERIGLCCFGILGIRYIYKIWKNLPEENKRQILQRITDVTKKTLNR